jgi:hypothetical protein
MAALLLLLAPWAWALVQVLRHQHLDSGAVGIVIGLSGTLPALWLAWVGYLEAGRSGTRASDLSLEQAADNLAGAVRAQWEAEAEVRRLNDPYPLPVSWVPADASLTDAWDLLVKRAESGAGRPDSTARDTWAAGPEGLAGEGRGLVEVLAQVPTGRLVVLGGPVPILASVASWNPAEQGLRDWLSAQLVVDHPFLGTAAPTGMQQPNLAMALLASHLILPILDGLDEIPQEVRGKVISRINDAFQFGEQVIVTCRSQEYRDAVRPEGGVEVALRGAAAVQLRPLDADTVRKYLCDDASGSEARTRWDPVLKVLGTEAPAGQALETPLMVGLARAVYNARSGESAGALPEPSELCDAGLADRAAVESRLFDAFIRAAYRNDTTSRSTAQDAESWFFYLARHLERKVTSPDLAWWQLRRAIPAFPGLVAVTVGVLGGILGWLTIWLVTTAGVKTYFAPAAGAAIGVSGGFMAGYITWFVTWYTTRRAARASRRSLSGKVFGPVAGILAVAGLAAAVAGGSSFFSMVVIWGAAVSVMGWAVSVERARLDIRSVASPLATLAQSRRNAISVGLLFAAIFTAALVITFTAGGLAGDAALAVVMGVTFGVASSFAVAWPSYGIARIWLALRHRLPWRLMTFLDDAHKRGVLRRAGAVYQFRHIELQHRLTTRSSGSTDGS